MSSPDWSDAWQALCDKHDRVGYGGLTPPERVWYNVAGLKASIENGGLISYYYNSYADRLDDCMAALDRIGAEDVRDEVMRVNALFGASVPRSMEERNAVIDSWDDCDESVDALLEGVDEALMPMMDELEERLVTFLRQENAV